MAVGDGGSGIIWLGLSIIVAIAITYAVLHSVWNYKKSKSDAMK